MTPNATQARLYGENCSWHSEWRRKDQVARAWQTNWSWRKSSPVLKSSSIASSRAPPSGLLGDGARGAATGGSASASSARPTNTLGSVASALNTKRTGDRADRKTLQRYRRDPVFVAVSPYSDSPAPALQIAPGSRQCQQRQNLRHPRIEADAQAARTSGSTDTSDTSGCTAKGMRMLSSSLKRPCSVSSARRSSSRARWLVAVDICKAWGLCSRVSRCHGRE